MKTLSRMKRVVLVILVASLLASFPLSYDPLSQSFLDETKTIVYDDFENYPCCIFPSLWILVSDGAGIGYQGVSTEHSFSGIKSLRLRGSSDKMAVAFLEFRSSGDQYLGYELYVMVSDKGYGAYYDFIGFGELGGSGSYFTLLAPVLFNHRDYTIRYLLPEGKEIGYWEPGEWVHIVLLLDRDRNVVSIWINGELVLDNITTASPLNPYDVQGLFVSSGLDGVDVYYDNVRVFSKQAPGQACFTRTISSCTAVFLYTYTLTATKTLTKTLYSTTTKTSIFTKTLWSTRTTTTTKYLTLTKTSYETVTTTSFSISRVTVTTTNTITEKYTRYTTITATTTSTAIAYRYGTLTFIRTITSIRTLYNTITETLTKITTQWKTTTHTTTATRNTTLTQTVTVVGSAIEGYSSTLKILVLAIIIMTAVFATILVTLCRGT